MNYIEWSEDYYKTAMKFDEVIKRLYSKRKKASLSEKKELDSRIMKYRTYYYECMRISNHLMNRGKEILIEK